MLTFLATRSRSQASARVRLVPINGRAGLLVRLPSALGLGTFPFCSQPALADLLSLPMRRKGMICYTSRNTSVESLLLVTPARSQVGIL